MPYVIGTHRIWSGQVVSAGVDITDPEYLSSEEGDVTNFTCAVVFNENINSDLNDYVTGVTITVNAVPQTIVSGTRQANHAIVYYVIDTSPDANDVITWEYSDVAGDIEDEAGNNQLGDVTPQAVTNNIGTHFWFDNDADAMHLQSLFIV